MKTTRSYLAVGYLVTALAGTLLHFVYGWTGENPIAALFAPVNESTWEHMKLIFFPVLVWTLLMPESRKKETPSLEPALLLGNLAGTLLIPVLFYTYTGILGRNYAPLDISTFFLGLLAAFLIAWKKKEDPSLYQKRSAVYLLCTLMALLFFLFAFFPPSLGIFQAP